jgi:hypothetical protein
MLQRKAVSFIVALLLACVPALAQRGHEAGQDQGGNRGFQNDRRGGVYGNSRNQDRRNQNFYSGVRQGGRGGQYYDPRHANDGYDRRYHNKQGGIGPGKGALIGGGGGAVLGAVFGGGLKGTLIGGAAGAGIGAIVGEAAQSKRDHDHRR